MYINKRIVAGTLKDDATRFNNPNGDNAKFSFTTLQSRNFTKQDGTPGQVTEWTDHAIWVPPESCDSFAEKLVKGANVYIEGRHDVAKREVNEETREFHEVLILNQKDIQFSRNPLPYVNLHILGGHLGNDARKSPPSANGNVKFTFSTAHTRSYKQRNGDWAEVTTWFDHVFWPHLSMVDNYTQRLKKGAFVIVEGRHDVVMREVNEVKRYFHEVLVRELRSNLPEQSESSRPAASPSKQRAEESHADAFRPATFAD